MWSFTAEVPAERARLLQNVTFEAIAFRLQVHAQIVAARWDVFRDDRLKGCRRIEYLLRVPVELYDAFFNAPAGYRAQYAISALNGEEQNRRLLARLETDLRRFAANNNVGPDELIRQSLAGADAKIWINEAEVSAHLSEWQPEIDFPRWANTESGVGVRAPIGKELEVKGGWIDRAGSEQSDSAKAKRSSQLHLEGFS